MYKGRLQSPYALRNRLRYEPSGLRQRSSRVVWANVPPARIFAQYMGREGGITRGRDGNSHVGDWQGHRTWTVMSHLPIAYPVACGAALGPADLEDTVSSAAAAAMKAFGFLRQRAAAGAS